MKLSFWFCVRTCFGCAIRSAHLKNTLSHRAAFAVLCLLGVDVLQMLWDSWFDIYMLYLWRG